MFKKVTVTAVLPNILSRVNLHLYLSFLSYQQFYNFESMNKLMFDDHVEFISSLGHPSLTGMLASSTSN